MHGYKQLMLELKHWRVVSERSGAKSFFWFPPVDKIGSYLSKKNQVAHKKKNKSARKARRINRMRMTA